MSERNGISMNGKTAFVTGGASGIGRATALAFARQGANVVVTDVNDDGGERTKHMIEELGGKAIYVRCDVSRDVDVTYAIDKTLKTFGTLDYAFNNAGIEGHSAPVADWSEEEWNRLVDINLKGVWLCMKHQLKQMLDQKSGGTIVNCSSIAGLIGFQGAGPYCASKHGIIGLTRAAALEYATRGIRVNAVCPGVIQTPMIDRYTQGKPELEAQLASGAPMKRMGTPEEIASAVIWLSSPQASYLTGLAMQIDGGWVAQ